MDINWDEFKSKDELFDENIYEKILTIENSTERMKEEQKLFDTAKKFKATGTVKSSYAEYKKRRITIPNSLVFDNGMSIVVPGYFLNDKQEIYNLKFELVTATPIYPVKIYVDKDTEEEFVKCEFYNGEKWSEFMCDRETLLHGGKITRLAKKGIDVTNDSSRLLVAYLRAALNSNDFTREVSTSKLGWHEGSFLPYDDDIEFDGENDFKVAFKSLHSNGSYDKWKEEMYSVRNFNKVIKVVMAVSFASVLLQKMHRASFVTMVWGDTGARKKCGCKNRSINLGRFRNR